MPSIKRIQAATTADALNGLQFKVQPTPTLVSLYASGAAGGADVVSFQVDGNSYLVNAAMNAAAAAGVVDTDRDQILFRELVPAGEFFMPITSAGATQFLLVIERP